MSNTLTLVGKSSSFFCAGSLGLAAGGFIIGFNNHFGMTSSWPDWEEGVVYFLATLVGVNAAYRIWRVAKVGAPKGLEMIIHIRAVSDSPNVEDIGKVKYVSVLLAIAAGTTYGGFAYLGVTNIFPAEASLWERVISGIIIIGSNFLATGALFSYAWLQNLQKKSFFTLSRSLRNQKMLATLASLFSLFGLGCTMTLGSYGLAKSISNSSKATIIGTAIAIVGFIGEMPFAIKQSCLLISKLCHYFTRSTSEQDASIERPFTTSRVPKLGSQLLYLVNSFCATYVAIGSFSASGRVMFAVGSAFLSLVSCMEEENKNPETNRLNSS